MAAEAAGWIRCVMVVRLMEIDVPCGAPRQAVAAGICYQERLEAKKRVH